MFAKLPSLVFAAFVASPVLGQSTAPAQTQHVINQLVENTCNGFLAPTLGRKEIASLAAERAIETAVVCPCASRIVYSDPRLSRYIVMSDEAFMKASEQSAVRSYVSSRVLQSVLQCFSQELDLSLKASTAMK